MMGFVRRILPVDQAYFTLQLFVAGGLALLTAWIFGLPTLGSSIVIFYAMLAIQPTLGGTLSVILPFFGWASSGIVVGLVTALVFDLALGHHSWIVWPALAIGVVFGALVLPRSRFAAVSVITALLILGVGLEGGEPLVQALLRALYVLIAAMMSVTVSYLVFPRRASGVVEERARSVLGDARNVFHAIKGALQEVTSPWDEKARVEEVRALREDVHQYELLVGHLRRENSGLREQLARQIVVGQHRMITYLEILARMVDSVRSNSLLAGAQSALASLTGCVEELLGLWAKVLESPPALLSRPSLESLDRQIAEVSALKRDLNALPSVISLLHCLRAFAGMLSDVIGETFLLGRGRKS